MIFTYFYNCYAKAKISYDITISLLFPRATPYRKAHLSSSTSPPNLPTPVISPLPQSWSPSRHLLPDSTSHPDRQRPCGPFSGSTSPPVHGTKVGGTCKQSGTQDKRKPEKDDDLKSKRKFSKLQFNHIVESLCTNCGRIRRRSAMEQLGFDHFIA